MNKWTRSFLLHPFVNRYNLLYLMSWFCTGLFTELPHVFITGLAVEAAYLIARAVLDRSGNPKFQVRKLSTQAKRRFLTVAQKAATIEQDFQAADSRSKLLNHSLRQAKRLTNVFLDLLIMDWRITRYVHTIKENYDQKIAQLSSQLDNTDGEIKALVERNLEIYRKRREKYFEMLEKQLVIRGRLDTIENTLNLLADTALGLRDPADTSGQVELLLTNVQDAETFVNDIRQIVPQSSRMRVR